MIYPEAVRCLLSYIKFFDMRRDDSVVFDMRGEVIFLFCDTILGVPFEGYNGEGIRSHVHNCSWRFPADTYCLIFLV